MGTYSSKLGKPWFQSLGTSNSWNCKHPVPRLGSMGSNFWEPLVPRTGNLCFPDWEGLVRTFGNQQFLELGTHVRMTSNSWEWELCKKTMFLFLLWRIFFVVDGGLVGACHMFFWANYFLFFTWLANMFCLITRLLFAADHWKHAYCERTGGTGPINETKRWFHSNMQLLFSTRAFFGAGQLNKALAAFFMQHFAHVHSKKIHV